VAHASFCALLDERREDRARAGSSVVEDERAAILGASDLDLERAPAGTADDGRGGHRRGSYVRAAGWRQARKSGIFLPRAMNENFSLIVMCLFLLGSLAFLAQQLTSYH
jgi:hypothetical protein